MWWRMLPTKMPKLQQKKSILNKIVIFPKTKGLSEKITYIFGFCKFFTSF